MKLAFVISRIAKYVLTVKKNLKYTFYICSMQNAFNLKPLYMIIRSAVNFGH